VLSLSPSLSLSHSHHLCPVDYAVLRGLLGNESPELLRHSGVPPPGIFLRASVGSEIALRQYVVVLDCSLGYVFEA
jgi:hypothetical protein